MHQTQNTLPPLLLVRISELSQPILDRDDSLDLVPSIELESTLTMKEFSSLFLVLKFFSQERNQK